LIKEQTTEQIFVRLLAKMRTNQVRLDSDLKEITAILEAKIKAKADTILKETKAEI
jgi:hypothetical protein